MDQVKLTRLLNSVGKKVFIDFYDVFSNQGISNEEKISKFPSEYEVSGTRTRINCASRIFREGMQKQALDIVISSRVDNRTKLKAKEILQKII